MAKTKINEDLERFKKLFGYNPSKGNELNEVRRHTYSINEYGDYADDGDDMMTMRMIRLRSQSRITDGDAFVTTNDDGRFVDDGWLMDGRVCP